MMDLLVSTCMKQSSKTQRLAAASHVIAAQHEHNGKARRHEQNIANDCFCAAISVSQGSVDI